MIKAGHDEQIAQLINEFTGFFSLICVAKTSAIKMGDAIEAAFCSAERQAKLDA